MGDPGLSHKSGTLLAAWRLLGSGQPAPNVPLSEDAGDAIEQLALGANLRLSLIHI